MIPGENPANIVPVLAGIDAIRIYTESVALRLKYG